ncbi:MAG TPA: SagB/ThcOx family dehydrogenase [Chthoniobacterales bacterium]|nr:SagB/ThcOx family dehydrogenase [Chthoniobacterales bacterium]
MFRTKTPIAWTFHRNSSRWPYNTLRLDENRHETPPFKEMADAPASTLPPPAELGTGLSDAIRRRYSCRRFTAESVSLEAMATILFSAYGNLGIAPFAGMEMVTRPVPSGGGLYPLELYAIVLHVSGLPGGIYHYNALGHLLERIRPGRMPMHLLSELFMGQPYVAQSGFVLVLTAVFDRSLWKYEDRGYRYLLFEAGHAAQNANLTATALGLGSLNLGGFFDVDLLSLLQLDGEEEAPLYAVAIGQPEAGSPDDLRVPAEPFNI